MNHHNALKLLIIAIASSFIFSACTHLDQKDQSEAQTTQEDTFEVCDDAFVDATTDDDESDIFGGTCTF